MHFFFKRRIKKIENSKVLKIFPFNKNKYYLKLFFFSFHKIKCSKPQNQMIYLCIKPKFLTDYPQKGPFLAMKLKILISILIEKAKNTIFFINFSRNKKLDKKKAQNSQIGLLTKVTSCNDIWSSTQYQGV